MLTSTDVNFIFSCLFIPSIGDKGLFSTANIAQIAVVFLLLFF